MTTKKFLHSCAAAVLACALCVFGIGAPRLRAQSKQKAGTSRDGASKQSAASKKAATRFAARAGDLLGTMPTNKGEWGLLIVDAESGNTLFEQNPDKNFVPPSNTNCSTTHLA